MKCDEACYYHCTKDGTQKPDCIMNNKEKINSLKHLLKQAELEEQKEEFMNDDIFWTLDRKDEPHKLFVTSIHYRDCSWMHQQKLTDKEKVLVWDKWEKLQ